MVRFILDIDEEAARRLETDAKLWGRASAQEYLADFAHGRLDSAVYDGSDMTAEEVARSAAMLDERARRMKAGGGVDAKEALRTLAKKHGLEVPE